MFSIFKNALPWDKISAMLTDDDDDDDTIQPTESLVMVGQEQPLPWLKQATLAKASKHGICSLSN